MTMDINKYRRINVLEFIKFKIGSSYQKEQLDCGILEYYKSKCGKTLVVLKNENSRSKYYFEK